MPDTNTILFEGLDVSGNEYHIQFQSEISPTSAKGIDRESICVDRENTHSPKPVYTFDVDMNEIGPRKRPH